MTDLATITRTAQRLARAERDLHEQIRIVALQPNMSLRKLAKASKLSHETVRTILKEEK